MLNVSEFSDEENSKKKSQWRDLLQAARRNRKKIFLESSILAIPKWPLLYRINPSALSSFTIIQ